MQCLRNASKPESDKALSQFNQDLELVIECFLIQFGKLIRRDEKDNSAGMGGLEELGDYIHATDRRLVDSKAALQLVV
jgi:hypothetical protein